MKNFWTIVHPNRTPIAYLASADVLQFEGAWSGMPGDDWNLKGAAIEREQTLQRSIRSPEAWYRTLPHARISQAITGGNHTLINHFTGDPSEIEQPPLTAHVVAMHLGGAKCVHRRQGKHHEAHDVALGAMTLMPAYQANSWRTEGPIDFAHLTVSLGAVERIIVEEYDREPATYHLHATVGFVDPLLEQVFLAMLAQIRRESRSSLHLDSLLVVFIVSLLDRHSTMYGRRNSLGATTVHRRGGLAGWQIRRVIDHMHEHMHTDIALAALSELTGLSRAQFFRAFRQSTGRSPGQFLGEMRMRHAVMLLKTTALTETEIANALGFCHVRHFASAFVKRTGLSPRLFRASCQ